MPTDVGFERDLGIDSLVKVIPVALRKQFELGLSCRLREQTIAFARDRDDESGPEPIVADQTVPHRRIDSDLAHGAIVDRRLPKREPQDLAGFEPKPLAGIGVDCAKDDRAARVLHLRVGYCALFRAQTFQPAHEFQARLALRNGKTVPARKIEKQRRGGANGLWLETVAEDSQEDTDSLGDQGATHRRGCKIRLAVRERDRFAIVSGTRAPGTNEANAALHEPGGSASGTPPTTMPVSPHKIVLMV